MNRRQQQFVSELFRYRGNAAAAARVAGYKAPLASATARLLLRRCDVLTAVVAHIVKGSPGCGDVLRRLLLPGRAIEARQQVHDLLARAGLAANSGGFATCPLPGPGCTPSKQQHSSAVSKDGTTDKKSAGRRKMRSAGHFESVAAAASEGGGWWWAYPKLAP